MTPSCLHSRNRRILLVLGFVVLLGFPVGTPRADAEEIARLTPQTWDEFVPQGKEVDCIYGDFVLRNDQITVVVAQPLEGRNANMTVRNVGGMIIDLTRSEPQSDQLSAFYPGGGRFSFVDLEKGKLTIDGKTSELSQLSKLQGEAITLAFTSRQAPKLPTVTLTYSLAKSQPFISVQTVYHNPHQSKIAVDLQDTIRADRSFTFGDDKATQLYWAEDDWFGQAYGFLVEGRRIQRGKGRGAVLRLTEPGRDVSAINLEPGERFTVVRRVFPAANVLQVKSLAREITERPQRKVVLEVRDPDGPVNHAKITVLDGEEKLGWGRTNTKGQLRFALPEGKYRAEIVALGRPKKMIDLTPASNPSYQIQLAAPGYLAAQITDNRGGPIPCKIALKAIEGEDPFFGPDSADTAVHNLVYTHNGRFRQAVAPGRYQVTISHGPEYDAVFQTIEVKRGEATDVKAQLVRTVDSKGWVSTEYHSHSTPSGDNTSSQFGRVQNLLAEHIEFAPCTEHNRVDTYVPHLKKLGVEHLLATCSGMELTGSLGSVNHQNAFPLIYRPRTQDNGAPDTDGNPVVQIERLALWDNGSEKLVQMNHPDLVQVLRDRDQNGTADGGFEKMFGFVKVIEVHPPAAIFTPPSKEPSGRLTRNPIFHWMQMLNLGYRIPGVVNSDAHYNFHGSGWIRNFVKSSTDDPAKIDTMEMVRASRAGRIVMSNGPFMEVGITTSDNEKAEPVLPGGEIVAPQGKAELRVKVQCANWLDVNRVQVFINGRPEKSLNFTRRSTPEKFSDQVVKFDAALPLSFKSDAHVIVATIGEGLSLEAVMGAEWGKSAPVAVSNPIFVDADGDGFQANSDLLDVPLPKE